MQTERLTVRPVREDDWSAIRAIWEDFKRSEYALYDTYKSTEPEDVRARIAKWAEATRIGNDHLFFVSCLDGRVIGFTSLNRRDGGFEIGYGFLKAFQGQGFASETLTALLAEMRKRNRDGKFFAGTALKNLPSVNLLTRLGFKQTGTETLSFHKDRDGNDLWFEGGIFELD